MNKFGGLIYSKDFSSKVVLSGNDYLRVASTFHSLHEISEQISPLRQEQPMGSQQPTQFSGGNSSLRNLCMTCISVGIETIDVDNFTLSCFKSLTGKVLFEWLCFSNPLFLNELILTDLYFRVDDFRNSRPRNCPTEIFPATSVLSVL